MQVHAGGRGLTHAHGLAREEAWRWQRLIAADDGACARAQRVPHQAAIVESELR
jgi:hypothetical protein